MNHGVLHPYRVARLSCRCSAWPSGAITAVVVSATTRPRRVFKARTGPLCKHLLGPVLKYVFITVARFGHEIVRLTVVLKFSRNNKHRRHTRARCLGGRGFGRVRYRYWELAPRY